MAADSDGHTDVVVLPPQGDRALRRLPDVVYGRAIRDLFGIELPADVVLPGDGDTRGFHNQGDVLEVSPALLAAWERGAERVLAEVLRRPGHGVVTDLVATQDLPVVGELREWHGSVRLFEAGLHEIALRVSFGEHSPHLDTVDVELELWIAGGLAHEGIYELTVDDRELDLRVQRELTAGLHDVHVEVGGMQSWRLTSYAPRFTGPLSPTPNPQRDALVTCDLDADPESCTAEIVARIARRAWRRPLREGELDGLVAVATAVRGAGGTVDDGLGAALRAVITSPHFLFLVELDGDADHPLAAWELGARLAETLWGSVPDEALLARVDDGTLTDPAVLRAEIDRMLADPRALEAVTSDLLIDWFGLDGLSSMSPNPGVYPTFDESLRDAMQVEVDALLASFVGTGRPLMDLVTTPRAHVPRRLGQHYGTYAGADIDVGGTGRYGILGTGAVLTLTSNPDRSSSTRRGRFVLERLLCDPPGDVPPGVPPLPEGAVTPDLVSEHTSNPVCAECHAPMDPLGFALERFDGIGAVREGADDVGRLPDGTEIRGLSSLVAHLAAEPAVSACLAEQVVVWGLGRDARGAPDATAAVRTALDTEGTLDAALVALFMSDAFRQHRRVE